MRGLFVLGSLLASQRAPWNVVDRVQAARLRRVVEAAAGVPFWRGRLEQAAIRPDAVRSLDDLRALSPTGKAELQEAPPADLLARGADPGRCLRTRTSGATGIPLEIVSRPADRRAVVASWMRVWLASGRGPSSRVALLEARPAGRPSWYERLGVYPRRSVGILQDPADWAKSLGEWHPDVLQGYSLSLKLLAEEVLRGGQALPIPVVVSTSGVLDEGGRALLARAFGGKVVDAYGAEEAGAVLAWECPACRAYHLATDAAGIEVLRDDGSPASPGEEGEVVVTNLWNRTMPLLRYRLGDRATLADRPARCGRSLPLMDRVLGREADLIVLPSGRRLTPHPFFVVMDEAAGVGEWRLTQTAPDRIEVEIAPAARVTPELAARVAAELGRLTGGEATVRVVPVDRVERGPGGKLRSVVSLRGPGSGIL